jgi:hypothetical protein
LQSQTRLTAEAPAIHRRAGVTEELGTLYVVEDACSADFIAGERPQLSIRRGAPEQVID